MKVMLKNYLLFQSILCKILKSRKIIFFVIILFVSIQSDYILAQKIIETDINDSNRIKLYSMPVMLNRTDTFVSIFNYDDMWQNKEHWKIYYSNAHKYLHTEVFFSNDTCYMLRFYKNGQIKFKDAILDKSGDSYQSIGWCENGQLVKNIYKNDTLITHYYCNGNKSCELIIKNNVLTGYYKKWYENGNLKEDTYYFEDKKTGNWKFYDINGILNKEEFYKNDSLIKVINY
ncbi:MAG: hypothetical protein A2033_09395 [Bacteroidetes bacterium GWA2_31_9]|nr:MAG: hypothetical protein A2033_09395 [Bacteroidetes bacterium GWA2_31_9]